MRLFRALFAVSLALCAACSLRWDEKFLVDPARRAGVWIEQATIRTEHGVTWPVEPGATPLRVERNLYAGSAGVVVFLVELAHATGEARWLALARDGARELAASIPEQVSGEAAGLYTGLAGLGYALGVVELATNDAQLRAARERVLHVLHASAVPEGEGVAWGPCNDVISGLAGIGFFLDWSARTFARPEDAELARRAARTLVARAERTEHGLDWPMDASFPRRMPNFSHGTAGVATFLARVGSDAHGELAFRRAALEGARELIARADRSDGGFRVHHHRPGGEQLYYYGWCHGPAGTSQLFTELARTGLDVDWRAYESACAQSLVAAKLPGQGLDGWWNNVGRCCGSAGALEFFAARMEHAPFEEASMAIGRGLELITDLRCRARSAGDTDCWPQAEHRTRPEQIQAQTGLMQGAAGIGLAILHYQEALAGVPRIVRLPDEALAPPAR